MNVVPAGYRPWMRLSTRAAVAGMVVVAAAVAVGLFLGGGPAESASAQQQPTPPQSGQQIWSQDCAICHGVDAKGSFQGPPIDDQGTAAVDFMVRTGRMPAPFRPDSSMFASPPDPDRSRHDPQYSDAEIADLVRFTAGFISGPAAPPPPDVSDADVSAGGELYRLNCAACHQMAGSGGVLSSGVASPPLGQAEPLDVLEAMRTGPGDMPVFDRATISDSDATEIAAYVEYLRDPRDRGGLSLWHLGPVPEGLVAWVVGISAILLLCRWLGTRQKLSTD